MFLHSQMPTSLVFREMQIKTTIRYYFTLIKIAIIKKKQQQKITSVGKDVEKLEPLHIAGQWNRVESRNRPIHM